MTNEEKAKEIVGYNIDISLEDMSSWARDEYTDLIKMAKFKDEEFLAILVDLRERAKTTPETTEECIDNIIEEKFPELYNEANSRTEPGFYCQGEVCSWEDMYKLIGKEAMMHDYPYHFDEDGNDIYPKTR